MRFTLAGETPRMRAVSARLGKGVLDYGLTAHRSLTVDRKRPNCRCCRSVFSLYNKQIKPHFVPGVLYAISRSHPLEASRSRMGTADGNDPCWVYCVFTAAGYRSSECAGSACDPLYWREARCSTPRTATQTLPPSRSTSNPLISG